MPETTGIQHRIIYYIDGLNLHFSFRKKTWEELNWLDIVKFCGNHLPARCNCSNLTVKYYTSLFEKHSRAGKAQDAFIKANEKINTGRNTLEIIKGKHQMGSSWCGTCQDETPKINEKKTDVNIAIDMLEDAVIKNVCDISVLISNDTDLVPSIKKIQQYKPQHRIVILVPPTDNINYDLQYAAGSRTDENVIVFLRGEYTNYLNAKLDEAVVINATHSVNRPDIYKREWLTEENRKLKEAEKERLKAAKSEHKLDSSLSVKSEDITALKNKFGSK
jgi:uncharacterized LabA/DUF88 family protein